MKTTVKVIGAFVAIMAIISMASCVLVAGPSDALVSAAKELKTVIPALQAGISLAKPEDPSERALTPSSLKTTGASTGNNWTYGSQTPAQVYGSGTVRKRFPASGNYELANGDQLYFTLIPELTLGATYYRMVLYTYPAFDLSVAYTIEEYIVDSAALTPGWAWGNMNLSEQLYSWISLTTVYLDGTSGSRTVRWVSGAGTDFYPAFAVPTPNPSITSSFVGYRMEESATPPLIEADVATYSSHVTEIVQGKKVSSDSIQYYTETSSTVHSGLTYVYQDKKHKWAEDTNIVTRMEEDTSAKTKKIRSVGEIGTTQYYIDKVDIAVDGGRITYVSSHDVFDAALPRSPDHSAKDYVALDLLEDSTGAGTFTGSMVETQGDNEVTRDVKVDRDNLNRFQVSLKYKSSGARPKGLADDIAIPLTRQDLSNIYIPLSGVSATFRGYYESGILYGTITSGSHSFDLVVADEGVAFDDVLYPY
jgi:hypothetical protein